MCWIDCDVGKPPDNIEVKTRVEDIEGNVSRQQNLSLFNNLWFLPDMSMMVYYRPTHWKPLI